MEIPTLDTPIGADIRMIRGQWTICSEGGGPFLACRNFLDAFMLLYGDNY